MWAFLHAASLFNLSSLPASFPRGPRSRHRGLSSPRPLDNPGRCAWCFPASHTRSKRGVSSDGSTPSTCAPPRRSASTDRRPGWDEVGHSLEPLPSVPLVPGLRPPLNGGRAPPRGLHSLSGAPRPGRLRQPRAVRTASLPRGLGRVGSRRSRCTCSRRPDSIPGRREAAAPHWPREVRLAGGADRHRRGIGLSAPAIPGRPALGQSRDVRLGRHGVSGGRWVRLCPPAVLGGTPSRQPGDLRLDDRVHRSRRRVSLRAPAFDGRPTPLRLRSCGLDGGVPGFRGVHDR